MLTLFTLRGSLWETRLGIRPFSSLSQQFSFWPKLTLTGYLGPYWLWVDLGPLLVGSKTWTYLYANWGLRDGKPHFMDDILFPWFIKAWSLIAIFFPFLDKNQMVIHFRSGSNQVGWNLVGYWVGLIAGGMTGMCIHVKMFQWGEASFE